MLAGRIMKQWSNVNDENRNSSIAISVMRILKHGQPLRLGGYRDMRRTLLALSMFPMAACRRASES